MIYYYELYFYSFLSGYLSHDRKSFFCPKKVVLDPGSSLEPTTKSKAFRYSQESQYG